ncbi:flavin reductase family protein [Nocardioides sp. YIM 152315]|uniref:flavin reductase family protein n=1 Tax=Nocardioides sp. YIM 152315 TaxID=3031760 RepID=UPI0023DBCA3D|nr:flavin reductase family protein [Nocardioides sp. YIM 152315]MDF1603031.1 flavin reductase family protein [Nocardioides sp. YIM 152315]
MTIHDTHPFADPDPDPVRRLRGRLGATVALVTTGAGSHRAGLTVSSLMVANGEPARVLLLVDPDSELAEALTPPVRAVVQLLSWSHRDLADAFAGTAPAPGGPWRMAAFADTEWGPVLTGASTWAGVSVESAAEVGWSLLLTCVIDSVTVGDDAEPLVHRRGRYVRPAR